MPPDVLGTRILEESEIDAIDAEIDGILTGLDEPGLERAARQLGDSPPAARVQLARAELALEDGDLEVFRDIRLFTWFLEADYFVKPWLTTYARYEQLHFNSNHFQEHKGIERGVVGAVFTVRANMRVVTEFLIDARGRNDEGEYSTNDAFTVLLDFAF